MQKTRQHSGPQFTPFIDSEAAVSSRSVLPDQFGRFLIDVFDEWIRLDVGRVFVQIFDQALSAWLDIEPSLCVFRKTCGRALAMEHNGDVYSCDHFVEPDYLLGNINVTPLEELVNNGRQQAFGDAKQTTLPQYCRDCEVQFACNGECPKNRFLLTPDGEENLNYLCAGYRAFFNHIDKPMKQMAQLLRAGKPAAAVMQQDASQAPNVRPTATRQATPAIPGAKLKRNDPLLMRFREEIQILLHAPLMYIAAESSIRLRNSCLGTIGVLLSTIGSQPNQGSLNTKLELDSAIFPPVSNSPGLATLCGLQTLICSVSHSFASVSRCLLEQRNDLWI